MSLLHELKRRNVLRVGAAYIVTAWLVIQVVETIFPAFGFGDVAVRYVTIAFAVGLLPALVVTWVFEWTPEGLKKDADVGRDHAFAAKSGKRLDRIILLVLALALGYFAFDKFVLDPARDAEIAVSARQEGRTEALVESFGERSIAVLPFDDLSPDRDQAYFGEGIAEEMLNLLAHVNDLRVAGRTSSFTVAGRDLTIPQMAEALNVGHILEGSVRKAGNQLRITVQLIEARSDTHLWSQTYDRELNDIFAIQDEIAAEVVDQLQIKLLGGALHVRQADPEAYALYLQARHLFYNPSQPDDFERSGALFRRAMEIDPEFIDAISGYARYLILSGETEPGEESNEPRIRAMVDRALAIDPDHPVMLAWRSLFALEDDDVETAARYRERAFESDPTHYDLLWGSVMFLPQLGRSDLAAEVGEYLLSIDPLCQLCRDVTARAYRNLGNFERSIEILREGLELDDQWFSGRFGLTQSLVYAGRPQEALENAIELEQQRDGGPFPGHLEALHDLGMLEEFETRLPEFIAVHADEATQYVAKVYAWIGDSDNAFEWLEKMNTGDSCGVRGTIVRAAFRKLYDDPRMQALLERCQLTPEQIEEVGLDLRLPSLGR